MGLFDRIKGKKIFATAVKAAAEETGEAGADAERATEPAGTDPVPAPASAAPGATQRMWNRFTSTIGKIRPGQGAPTGEQTAEGVADEGKTETEAAEAAGSRKILAKGASLALRGYKRTLDAVLERFKPHFPLDNLVTLEEIRQVLAAPREFSRLSDFDLMRIASNHPETLDEALRHQGAMRSHIQDRVEAAERALKASPKNKNLKKAAEETKAELARFESPETEWNLLLAGIGHLVKQRVAEATADFEKLEKLHPGFNHPVLARFMVEHLQKLNAGGSRAGDLRRWVDRALHYFPLDLNLLRASVGLLGEEESRLQRQLVDLLAGGSSEGTADRGAQVIALKRSS